MLANLNRKKINHSEFWFLQTQLKLNERTRATEHIYQKENSKINIYELISYSCDDRERKQKLLKDLNNNLENPMPSLFPKNILSRLEIENILSKKISHPSLLALQYCGNPEILKKPRVAIIGSRKPTLYGREQAYRFAKELAFSGCTIISGGAIGIDTIATSVALEHGCSCVILGSGINRLYPSSNTSLFQNLKSSSNGLLLSEFSTYENPNKWNFPRRNHTIAALADIVLVVEATGTSGSLITANAACDQGIDVGAIPGSIDCINSEGTNELIKNGAFCIQSPKDILERILYIYKSSYPHLFSFNSDKNNL